MEIIEKLGDHELWQQYLEYKLSRNDLRKRDREDLITFINNREYEPFVEKLALEKTMSTPRIIEVNKNASGKKRTVFSFEREENYILKMITYLLKRYDYLFSDNLYSFRNETGVKKALIQARKIITSGQAYSYKVDIHDYFNSINIEKVLNMLELKLPEELWLREFFKNLFANPYAIRDGEKITIKKGVMAGTPTAGFLANLYLSDLDRHFLERGITYARYSDDIIVFAESSEKIKEFEDFIKVSLAQLNLEVNPAKEARTLPGEPIEFLGFDLGERETDVSDMAVKKIKGKIRRKAKALYRWKIAKGASDERAVKALIRYLNDKFYNNSIRGEITWARWYFPFVTVDNKLKIIDEYCIECIRFLYTGKHNRKNYNLRYETIVSWGYKSLVNSFWKFKKGTYGINILKGK